MNLKRFAMVLAAVLALAALTASSAFAAATTTKAPWVVGGRVITAPVAVTMSGSATLKATIGATNTPVTLTASGIDCTGCTIFNTSGNAEGSGVLTFTGVKVTTPAHCQIAGGMISTNTLHFEASYMIGTAVYIKFSAPTGSIATVMIATDGTGACLASGSYKLTGVFYLKAVNVTATYGGKLSVTASQAINEEASGETEPLKFEGKKAELSGTASFEAGGSVFGVE